MSEFKFRISSMTPPEGAAALAVLAADGLAGAGWSSSLSVLVLMRKYRRVMLVYVYVCICAQCVLCTCMESDGCPRYLF